MINLRSKPLEGHITDSSGNLIRNSNIIIKQLGPNGAYSVDSITSDDDGYFVSDPMPNGVYDIYESGIKISRIIHHVDEGGIQCYQANSNNYNFSTLINGSNITISTGSFSDLIPMFQVNAYRQFIQLESSNLDIDQSGNIFPIYERDISVDVDNFNANIYNFYNLNSDSRLTTSRFDIEYYTPTTRNSTVYQRIKWVGVPAIRFYKDSNLMIPLDYYSLIPSQPKIITTTSFTIQNVVFNDFNGSNFNGFTSYWPTILALKATPVADSQLLQLQNLNSGDVLKLNFNNGSLWYGIIDYISIIGTTVEIIAETWLNKNISITSPSPILDNINTTMVTAFCGLFQNIMNISNDINQRFHVVENNIANNSSLTSFSEMYNY